MPYNQPPDSTYKRERPTVVTLLAIFTFIGGIQYGLALVGGVIAAPSLNVTVSDSNSQLAQMESALLALADPWHGYRSLPLLVLGLVGVPLSLIAGIGLWKLKGWARLLAIGLYGFVMIASFLQFSSSPPLPVVGFVSALIAISYLTQANVRVAFGEQ